MFNEKLDVYVLNIKTCPGVVSSHPVDYINYFDKTSLTEIYLEGKQKRYNDTLYFNTKKKQKKFLEAVLDSSECEVGVNCVVLR